MANQLVLDVTRALYGEALRMIRLADKMYPSLKDFDAEGTLIGVLAQLDREMPDEEFEKEVLGGS